MARKKQTVEEVKMELTPMIDVVFLLLIFFIVTIKFKVLEGKLETELPKDVGVNQGDVELLEKIELRIAKATSNPAGFIVQINGRTMPNMATLRSELTNWLKMDDEARATLYPDVGVTYEQVVQVVDQCIMVKLTNLTFAGVKFDA
jgi:biopolymer transport protein ExbD